MLSCQEHDQNGTNIIQNNHTLLQWAFRYDHITVTEKTKHKNKHKTNKIKQNKTKTKINFTSIFHLFLSLYASSFIV